jgi:hypothetical protein
MQINKFYFYKIFSMLFVVFAVAACNGGTPSSDTSNPQEGKVTGIQIAPKDVAGALPTNQIPLGASIQYVATAYYDNNTSRDVSSEVVWSSSTPAVIIDNGIITAMEVGSTDINATFSGITSNQVSLSVSNATVIAIQIEPVESTGLEIPVGLSLNFQAKALYSDNSLFTISSSIEWSSSNLAVASINNNGKVVAESHGVTQVSANWKGLESNTLDVSVVDKVLTSLSIIAPPSAMRGIPVGISQQYRAVAKFDDNSSTDITSQVSWSSSDINMVNVSTTGLVEAKAIGTVTLSANIGNVVSNTLRVTLISAAIQSIQISTTDSDNSVIAGFTKRYKAIVAFSDGSIFDITRLASWRSGDQSILLALTSGRILGLQSGESGLVAQWNGMTSNSILVTVGDAIPVEIKTTPAVVDLEINDTSKLIATLTLSDNSTVDVSEDVLWESSNPSVASVTASGVVTGHIQGNATINTSHTTHGVTLTSAADVTVLTKSGPDFSVGCGISEVTTSSGMTFICPLTKSEADKFGLTYDYVSWDSGRQMDFITMTPQKAEIYCKQIGANYAVPTIEQLSELYAEFGNMGVYAQWHVYKNSYWSATRVSSSFLQKIELGNGSIGSARETDYNLVTCVR